jgi:quercetin dioxygenase-like cupin family protein
MKISGVCKSSMSRLCRFVGCVALFSSAALSVQADDNPIHIPGASLDVVPMAAWGVDGTILTAVGQGAVDDAPDGASRYGAKEYDYPMGSLRVLTFDSSDGPVLHEITTATELFLIQGSATVGSSGTPVSIVAGDAVFLPDGVLQNDDPSEDTVVALFTVANTAENPDGMVIHGADLEQMTIAQYVRDGQGTSAVKPEDRANAPENSGVFDLKRYVFDGNSIRLAMLHQGGSTNAAANSRTDILIYITKGRMLRTEDGVEYEVVGGDAIREEFGKTGHWDLLEESEFLATDMPIISDGK